MVPEVDPVIRSAIKHVTFENDVSTKNVPTATSVEGLVKKVPPPATFPALEKIKKAAVRRSSRSMKKIKYGLMAMMTMASQYLPILDATDALHNALIQAESLDLLADQTYNGTHYSKFVFNATSTKASDNETYTWSEMLKQPDRISFTDAMQKETDALFDNNVWELMPRRDMPKDTTTIMSIWAFKRKRTPDGALVKYKARINAHGGQSKWGIHYWETYSPTVNWMSVRTMLVLKLCFNLEARAADFVLAFSQAPIKTPTFLEIPLGMRNSMNQGYVLKLLKNLYGLKDAGRTWWEHLSDGMWKRGFEPSAVDPSVWIRHDCIALCFVDDILFFSKTKAIGQDVIKSLSSDFAITDEGEIDKYLGIKIKETGKRPSFSILSLTRPQS